MSAPPLTAPATGSAPARAPAPAARRRAPVWTWPVLACVALAALSLLLPSQPTYDPWAWLIWGREIVHWDLVTMRGPSWKPLPVLFTTPFALLGDRAAPDLWLVVARAGGLFAIVLAYRLGARLAGRAAGAIAAAGLVLSAAIVHNFARGNSEGLLVALGLAAVERHLDGRRRHAFLLALGAALLRPEIWPFFGLYGLWLAWRDARERVVVAAGFAACGLLWFVPEYLGSGDFFRAASRAREPMPGTPGAADFPFAEVLDRASGILTAPILAGALVATAIAAMRLRRGRPGPTDRLVLAFAAGSAVILLAVATLAQAGFTGNTRYLSLPAAFVCVLAGTGWVQLTRLAAARGGRRAGAALAIVAAAAALPFAVRAADGLRGDLRQVDSEAALYDDLAVAVARTGGPAAANACGGVYTGPFEVQVLAWLLHRHGRDVRIEARPPGTVMALRHIPMARDARFPELAQTRHWIVRRRCST